MRRSAFLMIQLHKSWRRGREQRVAVSIVKDPSPSGNTCIYQLVWEQRATKFPLSHCSEKVREHNAAPATPVRKRLPFTFDIFTGASEKENRFLKISGSSLKDLVAFKNVVVEDYTEAWLTLQRWLPGALGKSQPGWWIWAFPPRLEHKAGGRMLVWPRCGLLASHTFSIKSWLNEKVYLSTCFHTRL